MKISNIFISVFIIIMSLTFLCTAKNIPHITSVDPAGPKLFPVIAAWLTLFSICLSLIIDMRSQEQPLKEIYRNLYNLIAGNEKKIFFRMTAIISVSLVYPYFMINAGFLIGTACYIFILQQILRQSFLSSSIISITVPVILYFIFVYFLQASVPEGEWLMCIMD